MDSKRDELYRIVKFEEPTMTETVIDENHSSFVIEPLIRGYGMTIGNALRRVLLSSMPGASAISVKIDGVLHEFSTVPDVVEDVTEMILNIKGVNANLDSDEPVRACINAVGPCEVTAGDIICSSELEISNKDHHIATIENGGSLVMELMFDNGIGYVTADDNKERYGIREIGTIPIDSLFTPVTRAAYTVEPTRVAGRLDHDKLTIEVVTDGSITPGDAMSISSRILIGHFMLVDSSFGGEGNASIFVPAEVDAATQAGQMPIEDLELSVRASNCLKRDHINYVSELLEKTNSDLYKIRNMGKKSVDEIIAKVEAMGFKLKDEE